jgi:hypothetical protein
MKTLAAFNLFPKVEYLFETNESHLGYDSFSQQSQWSGNATPFSGSCTYILSSTEQTVSKCYLSPTTYGCTMTGSRRSFNIPSCD